MADIKITGSNYHWGQYETTQEVADAIDAAPNWRDAFDDYMNWEHENGRMAAHEQAVDPDVNAQDEFHRVSLRRNQAIKLVQNNDRTVDECIEQAQISFFNGMRQGFLERGAVDTDEQRFDRPTPQQPEIRLSDLCKLAEAQDGVPRNPKELLARLRARAAEQEEVK